MGKLKFKRNNLKDRIILTLPSGAKVTSDAINELNKFLTEYTEIFLKNNGWVQDLETLRWSTSNIPDHTYHIDTAFMLVVEGNKSDT